MALNNIKPFYDNFLGVLPSNLELDNLLLDCPPKFKYLENHPEEIRDNMIYILSCIWYARGRALEQGYYLEQDDYVSLYSKILQSVIKNYKEYIEYLIRNEVIECNMSYQARSHSLGYRFTEKYRCRLRSPQHITIFNPSVLSRIQKSRISSTAIAKYRPLYTWLNHLTFDKDEALDITYKLYYKQGRWDEGDRQADVLYRLDNPHQWTVTAP